MSEPLANMWTNWNLLRKESFRAEAEVERAGLAMQEAVAEVEATSRELRDKLELARRRAHNPGVETPIETPTPFEHSLPAAPMLNM
jgi:hypothetical protein